VGAFQLSKWYMDCASDSGEIVIAYAARLKWRAITLHYASLLVHEPGQKPRVQTTLRASTLPVLAGDVITWTCEALEVSGKWTALSSAAPETIYASPDGDVKWHCHQPRSRAEITIGDRVVRGFGYAEQLELSVEPWHMPIDSLRWGRFVGARSSLVWIDWRGAHEKKLVLFDGRRIESPEIEERAVSGEGVRLTIDEGATLRSGKLGKTALELVPGLERFPMRILAVDEHKWTARGTLEDASGKDEGFVIHEIVRWPEQKRASESHALGKFLYALLFVAILPTALVAWARATESLVTLPAVRSLPIGAALVAVGALLVLAGWASLWRDGGGLPMNAFPPPRLVTRGVYALFAHPIYVGFCAICFGASIIVGSASGLWLVSPVMTLATMALVLGYESHDLDARFGPERGAPLFGLPPRDDAPASIARRLAVIVFCVLPWLAFGFAGAHVSDVPAVLVAIASPLFARTNMALRRVVVGSLLAMLLLLTLPLLSSIAPAPIAAAALVAAPTWPLRALALAAGVPALLRAGVEPAIATVLACAIAVNAGAVWRGLRDLSERVANSWSSTRIGPIRVMNHVVWGFVSSAGGIFIIGTFTGPGHAPAIACAAAGGVVGAAIWAQLIEGSSSLSRPFGFYGGLLGICIGGSVGAIVFGTPVWLILAAVASSAAFIQAAGRVRCLVQGCCHGSETTDVIGIRVHNPQSRVCRLAHLDDVPIHATQLYSILWNALTFVVIGRLWLVHAPMHFVGGMYFVLNGLGRFAEEAFRGEPQTPIYARLRLYQWIALVQIVVGAIITALGKSGPSPAPAPNVGGTVVAIVFGVIYALALSVDFPESKRRFSRLA
jgi:prolipoprotein diacylglyceryltransferase/protein-S-isoprenylcysteine O-methyltransferase Ste14